MNEQLLYVKSMKKEMTSEMLVFVFSTKDILHC